MSGLEHLVPSTMGRAHRHLCTKALSELAHERIITPLADGGTDGTWVVDAGRSRYTFRASVLHLEHWVVDAESLQRTVGGDLVPLDALELITELAPVLGVPEKLLPTYLEEIAATLAAGAWKLTHRTMSAAALVEADFQTVEWSMTEGHPAFIANNGRIGFDLDDYAAYAPETGSLVALVWVALRRTKARLSLGAGVTEDALYAGQLDAATRDHFEAVLLDRGLEPAAYLYAPVHPWQWRHKLAVTLSSDVARDDVVHLGTGPADHRPQQSIRTFFDGAHPERHYVKMALSIQNMGFLRGLSPRYMAVTPAINDYVAGVVGGDRELVGFDVLRELAAVGYTGDAFQALPFRTPYQAMLAGLWRESPVPRVDPGDQLATMAALLHRDSVGASYVGAAITASGLEAGAWVRAYLEVYLRPLVHLLVKHDLAFMPHGENLILVLRDHVPVGAFLKDIGEEVAHLGLGELPEDVERIRATTPPDVAGLAILTDVFDGVLRYVAAILHTDGLLDQDTFWALVGTVLDEHETTHPELAEAVARYDLRRREMRHSCLNRLQLRNTLQMVDLADQAESLLFAGTLVNPVGPAGPGRARVTDLARDETPGFGVLTLAPVDPVADLDLLAGWLTEDRAVFWGMTDHSRDEIGEVYGWIDAQDTHHAFLVRLDGDPVALVQTYDPFHDVIGEAYDRQPGDVGMHFFIGPGGRRAGLTSLVLLFFARHLLSDASASRIVLEPDADNAAAVTRLERMGCVLGPRTWIDGPLPELPGKTAQLAFMTRDRFEGLFGGVRTGHLRG
jgi:siderophore synthetase component/RimJ/RimL family protein N-acetyltransferase